MAGYVKVIIKQKTGRKIVPRKKCTECGQLSHNASWFGDDAIDDYICNDCYEIYLKQLCAKREEKAKMIFAICKPYIDLSGF